MLLTFPSIHHVMKAEKLLRDAGIVTDMIPVPREISSDCGMCLAVDDADAGQVGTLLTRHQFPHPWAVHRHATASGSTISPAS